MALKNLKFNKTFTITGLNQRKHSKPIIVSTPDGKTYNAGADWVAAMLNLPKNKIAAGK